MRAAGTVEIRSARLPSKRRGARVRELVWSPRSRGFRKVLHNQGLGARKTPHRFRPKTPESASPLGEGEERPRLRGWRRARQGSPTGRPMTADLSALDIERRLTAIETTLPTLATKADIQAMRTEWKSDLGEMRSEWKAGFGELKAELHAREARLIKWVAGLVVAGAAAAAGVAIAVNQVLAAGVGG